MRSHPAEEAQRHVGDDYTAVVLEPSPPTVDAEPWFADDPLDPGQTDRQVVSPVGSGDLRYEDLFDADTEHARWCADRWLGFFRRLEPLTGSFAISRASLHLLAEHLVSPARRRANGRIALRYTRGGFGTPFFGADEQVRVEVGYLVHQRGDEVRSDPITTLAAAAELIGASAPEQDSTLTIEPRDAGQLGELYGFAASVLEELRAGHGKDSEPSRVQLWPEHFDIAIELGSEAAGQRAGYGVSPGDAEHPQPYAYVVPWGEVPAGELWQASGFSGAELPYGEIVAAADQRAFVLDFFASRLAALKA